jgi:hypothetical protein
MSFAQQLQRALDPALPLPLQIDLGKFSCSFDYGKLKVNYEQEQEGFRKLSRDELMQLMRRLQASPHVILLNLRDHGIYGARMQEMTAAIAVLSELRALVLSSACPTSPLKMVGSSHSTTATATPCSPCLTHCRE